MCLCVWQRRRRLDEWKERMWNSVPVLGAPDGVSVVGTIVVGATVGGGVVGSNVGVDVVSANVGIDVVGASVGAAAAHILSHPGCSAAAVHGERVAA
jgi:hypothetical protein